MKLTPVRVRGKRKASTITAAAESTPPPRPTKMQRSIQDVKHTRQLQPRVSLERLPPEILESILLYSGSVALPRASPIIGRKLSSRATLLRFFIWGFHDTWDQWFGIPFQETVEGPKTKDEFKGPRSPQEAKYFPCDGDAELQSALLELPWVDMDFILRAQQTWADTYARDRYYEPLVSPGGHGVFDAATFYEKEYAQFLRPQARPLRTIRRNVHPNTRLPLPLVTGPWDEDRQKRLLWLLSGGMNLETQESPTRTLPWEYHVEFLRNAVVDADTPNGVAYRCLRDQCDLMRVPRDVLRRERDSLVRRLQWGQHPDGVFDLLQEVLEDVNYKVDFQLFSSHK